MPESEREFRIGDIIKQGESFGQITGGAKGSWTVKLYNDKGVLGAASTGVADADLTRAGYSKWMSKSGIDTAMEVAWNGIVYSIIQKFRKSNPTFGPRFYSFLISDAAYELFLKFFLENMMPILRPDAISVASGWMPAQGDFHDAVKTIPIVLIQECVLKLVYNKKFFSHFLKNLIDSFICIVASNYTGRMVTSTLGGFMGGKDSVYRW